MEGVNGSEHSSVHHAAEPDADPSHAAVVAELWAGRPPRLFALVDETVDDDDRLVREVRAYGIALPNGTAATVQAEGRLSAGHWRSPESASRRFRAELLWITR